MKDVLKRVVVLSFVFLLTYFVARFSIVQSIVLSLLLALIVPTIRENIQQRKLIPFWLQIEPNLGAILIDVGLVESESDWWGLVNPKKSLEEDRIEPESREVTYRNLLRNGVFHCYVLSYDRESLALSVAWPYSNHYTSQINNQIDIDCISKGHFDNHPRVKIKPGESGYRILLEVNPSWFEDGWLESIQSKHQFEISPKNFLTGTVDLTVAIIPNEELLLFYWDASSVKQRNAALAKYGWTEVERNWELKQLGAPVQLSHRYATIAHKEI